jgi:hypothetical protein
MLILEVAATADVYVMRRLSDDVSIAYAMMRPYTAIPRKRQLLYKRREELAVKIAYSNISD